MSGKRLTSWIDSFLEYTKGMGSPELFCKWAGIACIAGALERKVWLRTRRGILYPNLYVLLVGPPGVGKTLLTGEIQDFLGELNEHYVGAASVTRASLIDDLYDAERRIINPESNPSFDSFNALMVISNEFGTLIPAYENDFINALTDIYDCKKYSERRRTKDRNLQIERPMINLLAATTPSYLNELMPEGAWDQGFISRVIMIYSGESAPQPLFDELSTDDKLRRDLIHDLQLIGAKHGKVEFEEDAARLISDWHMNGGEPKPDHPKLVHYNIRRTAHILKMCMIANMTQSADFIIKVEDFQTALDWLTEVEAYMPDIFKAMKTGGDSRIIEETWHFIYQLYVKSKKPVPEFKIAQFLNERVPTHRIPMMIEAMERARLIQAALEKGVGKAYTPKSKSS